jgi:hypothetical protein
MGLKNSIRHLLAATAIIVPSFALADSPVTFDWTYGGGSDSVYGFGTLTATLDPSNNGTYDILGGSGTREVNGLSYAVEIVSFDPAYSPNPTSYFPDSGGFGGASPNPPYCPYSPSSSCAIHDAGAGGVTADLIFDNVLYNVNGTPGYQLDGDGIVLYEPNAPVNDSEYYSVWGVGNAYQVGPADQEFDPYTYNGVNLQNPFTVSLAATPEPGTLEIFVLCLIGIVVAALRWRSAQGSGGVS